MYNEVKLTSRDGASRASSKGTRHRRDLYDDMIDPVHDRLINRHCNQAR